MNIATEKQLRIADNGAVKTLDYAGLLDFHRGDSWVGLSVGFRAMQLAGQRLSEDSVWDRRDLYVVSGHPGPGVRDAIEYVTRCVSRGRFRVAIPETAIRCSKEMTFEWQVNDGQRTVDVRLRSGFVPGVFFELLDRRDTEKEKHNDRQRFDDLKRELSARLWEEPLTESFEAQLRRARVASHA